MNILKLFIDKIFKKNREVSGLFLFITLFILVIILFIFLTFYFSIADQYFYIFFITALLFFIIDPFLKAHLPSVKANLLLLEIYIFFAHFAIVFSKDGNSIFFFLYIIPIISAAMTFGIRGSVFTTVAIFILYNLNESYTSTHRAFFGPQMQDDLPKFIALLIISIMLGFSSEENRKAEQRAYERMSKIVTLNEIKNSLKIEYNDNSLLKLLTNSIMKLMNCEAAAGLLLAYADCSIIERYENNFDLSVFAPANFQHSPDPEIISAKNKQLFISANLRFNNVIKFNLRLDTAKYIVIFITKRKDKLQLTASDLELTKTLKVYLDLILKNQDLYKQIQQVKDYLYLTFKNLPLGMIILDESFIIKFVNKHALLLLKYDDESEIVGKKLGGSFYIFPDAKIYEKIIKGEHLLFHKTQVSAKTLEIKQIELTVTPLKDEFGRINGKIISFIDITEVKEMEEELQRRDKLASLGQLAAGLAHEFRNPLGVIEGFASLLKKDLELNEPEKYKLASKIVDGVTDLNKIVTDFLRFTNKIQLKPENKNIIETIDKSMIFVRKLLEDNKIHLEKNYNNYSKILVEYDEDKIKQVILNILLNAIDALNDIDSPMIIVSVRIKESNVLEPEDKVCIDIFNNGGNIDESIKNNIFNPFFTTKSTGIGLGLTISQKIVNEHNGKLNFKNEKNGVKFTIDLPVDRRFAYKF